MSIFFKKSIGVDIADNSIEVAEIRQFGRSVRVESLGRVALPLGIVKNGTIIKEKELSEALKTVMEQAQPRPIIGNKVVFGFPESQAFIHFFSYPYPASESKIGKEELDRIVLNETWSNIPIAKREVLVEYEIVQRHRDRIDVLIAAANRRVVLEWQNFFAKLNLEIVTFDIEPLANFRNLSVGPKKRICLVDIGSAVTNIYIFHKRKLVYENSLDCAGNNMTDIIAKTLKISEAEAEIKKTEVDLKDPDSVLFTQLIKVLSKIADGIKEVIDYYQRQSKSIIEIVIFIGGSSKLKGLVSYFEANINKSVCLGEARYSQDKTLEFLGVVGVALRGIKKKYDAGDAFIPFVQDDDTDNDEEILSEDEPENKEEIPGALIDNRKKQISLQKKLLIALSLGIILLAAAYVYRFYTSNREQSKVKNIEINTNNFIQSNVTASNQASSQLIASSSQPAEIASGTLQTISSTTTSSPSAINNSGKMVIIKNTELGYLNIRSGPGANFSLVAKVSPGEIYELIIKQGDWVKIKISDTLSGWAAAKYITEKD